MAFKFNAGVRTAQGKVRAAACVTRGKSLQSFMVAAKSQFQSS